MTENLLTVLCLGDVVGRPGRDVLKKGLPALREEFGAELVIVNAENAAGGLGIDGRTADEIRTAGGQVLTLGDHTWHKKEMREDFGARTEWLIRPLNYPEGAAGRGWAIREPRPGVKVGVMNALGRVFIGGALDCPFRGAERILAAELADCAIVIMDFHAEATSEKVAFGKHFDGRIHAVVGTHTHVQTADEQILPGGSAYISDLGMCGSNAGVIGMKKEPAIGRFVSGVPHAYELAEGDPVVRGAAITFDVNERKAVRIERFARSAMS